MIGLYNKIKISSIFSHRELFYIWYYPCFCECGCACVSACVCARARVCLCVSVSLCVFVCISEFSYCRGRRFINSKTPFNFRMRQRRLLLVRSISTGIKLLHCIIKKHAAFIWYVYGTVLYRRTRKDLLKQKLLLYDLSMCELLSGVLGELHLL